MNRDITGPTPTAPSSDGPVSETTEPRSIADQPIAHPKPTASVALYWKRLLAPYSRADNRKAWFQLVTTVLLLAGNWALMYWSLSLPYIVTILLALPAAGLITRLFIFQHDCGHGSFFRSHKLNNLVGGLLGVPTLTPYRYWRRTHAIHHATSGNLDHREFGDIVTLTVDEYRARTPFGRLCYRIYRNMPILLTIGPIYQFIIKHRFPFDAPRAWKREWTGVMLTNLALAGIVALAWATIGLKAFLLVQVPITLITGALGMWLFFVQHQFEDTYWRENPQWSFHQAGLEGSSFYDLPRILHWFTGNIGYHHIHHLASRIPNYHLARCFEEVPDLHHVTRLTIAESLRCARLSLWDAENERLIRFSEIGKTVDLKAA